MATKIVNSLASLPAEVTVKKLVHRSNYEELWISFPESERICPHCGSYDCTIKDSGRDSSVNNHYRCSDYSHNYLFLSSQILQMADQKLHPQLSGRPVASLLNKVLYTTLQSITGQLIYTCSENATTASPAAVLSCSIRDGFIQRFTSHSFSTLTSASH